VFVPIAVELFKLKNAVTEGVTFLSLPESIDVTLFLALLSAERG
jgi:hypothetical protein